MTGRDRNFTFAGEHTVNGVRFEVVELGIKGIVPQGWYWRRLGVPADPEGPFPTAEGAYLAALGE